MISSITRLFLNSFSRFPSIRINPTVKKEEKRRSSSSQHQHEGFPRCEGDSIPVTFGGSLGRFWEGGSSKPGSASSGGSGGGGGGGRRGKKSNTIVPIVPPLPQSGDRLTVGRREEDEDDEMSVIVSPRLSISSVKRSISSSLQSLRKGAANSSIGGSPVRVYGEGGGEGATSSSSSSPSSCLSCCKVAVGLRPPSDGAAYKQNGNGRARNSQEG